jgi:hypothetical protein
MVKVACFRWKPIRSAAMLSDANDQVARTFLRLNNSFNEIFREPGAIPACETQRHGEKGAGTFPQRQTRFEKLPGKP